MLSRFFSGLFSGLLLCTTCFPQTDSVSLRLGPIHESDTHGSLEVLVELPKESTAQAKDFRLIEDGAVTASGAKLHDFRTSRWTLAFVLAIDVSRSLSTQQLDGVKQATSDFVSRLNAPIALVTFADSAVAATAFDTPRPDVLGQIAHLRPVGNRTRLYDALDKGLDLLASRQEPERQRIIVISDGAEDSLDQPDYIDQVISKAEKRRVAIDTIWIPTSTAGARNTLVRLSERTDGLHNDAKQSSDVLASLEQVVDRVNKAFVVSFERTLGPAGLTTHEVGISLDRPGLAPAAMALAMRRSAPPRSWSQLLHTTVGVLSDLKTLLGLLGALCAYVLSYFAVREYRPEALHYFPVQLWHVTQEKSTSGEKPTDPPSSQPPTVQAKKKERVTLVEQPGEAYPTGPLVLEGVSGPLRGKKIQVDQGSFSIGADQENNLSIPSDDYVSKKHAVIRAAKGGWIIEDQGSRNGIFLDGLKLSVGPSPVLRSGQSVQIGSSEFRVSLEEEKTKSAAIGKTEPVR